MRLPLSEKEVAILCDASEHAAGYVLLIDDYTDEETGETNNFAPVAFGSKNFTAGQMSLTMYAKELLAMHLAFDEFGQFLSGTKKSVKVMTGNKAFTRFFQASHIPLSLWKFL